MTVLPRPFRRLAFYLAASSAFLTFSTANAVPRAYISRCCDSGSSLILFDAVHQTQAARAPFGHAAGNATVSPDGKTAYFLDTASSALLGYDLATQKVVANIGLGVSAGSLFSSLSDRMIALTPDGSRAYVAVASLVGSSVGVIDLVNKRLLTRIPIALFPTSAVVLSKDGKYVYAPVQEFCFEDCTPAFVGVVDTAKNSVVTKLHTDYGSTSATLSPDGSRLYVANSGSVTYYDTQTNIYLGAISVAASGLAVKPDGTQLYVAEAGNPAIGVVDTSSETLVSSIPLSKGAITVRITPSGKEAYVLDGLGAVSIVKVADNTLESTINLPEAVDSVDFGKSGALAIMTDSHPSTVALASPRTNKISGVAFGPANPVVVVAAPDHSKVYVAGTDGLAVIDAATEAQTGFIPVGYAVQGMAISSAGTRALLAVYDDHAVISAVVVDLTSGETLATIPNEGLGYSAALSSDGRTGYVGDYSSFVVIDMNTFHVTRTVKNEGGNTAVGLAVSADGSSLYVAVSGVGNLDIFDTGTLQKIATVSTGAFTSIPIVMALTPDGKTIIVPDHNGSQLTFVDLSSRAVASKVPVSGDPRAVAITPDEGSVWACSEYTSFSTTVPVVDLASRTMTGNVNIGGTATGIVFLP